MKKILYVLIITSLLSLTACGSGIATSDQESAKSEISLANPQSESLSAENQSLSIDSSYDISKADATNSEVEPLELSPDAFVSKVSGVIDDAIASDDSIDDISLQNGNLLVVVTLGDPSPLSYEDLMISRTSSITDAILSLEDYFELWDTITIDFGEHGSIQNGHDNIQNNGYGSYFQSENFVITFPE